VDCYADYNVTRPKRALVSLHIFLSDEMNETLFGILLFYYRERDL